MTPKPDLLFGRLAVKGGYLTQGQVDELVRQQTEAAEAGVPTTLGELCQMKRLLTSEQVQEVLLAQEFYELRQEDRRLGQLAVMNEFVSQENVDLALEAQKEEFAQEKKLPRRLGRILIEMEVLTDQQLQALLKAQERLAGSGARPAVAEEVEALEDITDRTSSETPHDPAQAVEQPTGYLIQEAGEGSGRTMPLGRKAVIGRQPTNEVPIPDQGSSRQHARIEFIELAKQHVVYDLNSRNGTFVNGKPVTEPVALNPGDRIQIGDSVLRYEAGVGVTPGFISPGSTATTVDAIKMGSQLRNATAEMPAIGASKETERRTQAAPAPGAPPAPPPPKGAVAAQAAPPPAVSSAGRTPTAPAGPEQERTAPPAPSSRSAPVGRCANCGHALSEKARFCKACGSVVRTGAGQPAPATPRPAKTDLPAASAWRVVGAGPVDPESGDLPPILLDYVGRGESVLYLSRMHWMALVYAVMALGMQVTAWIMWQTAGDRRHDFLDASSIGASFFVLVLLSILPLALALSAISRQAAGLALLSGCLTPLFTLLVVAAIAFAVWTTCYAVTDKRIIRLWTLAGVFRIAQEVGVSKVESVDVSQMPIGLAYHYGTLQIRGSGGSTHFFAFVMEAVSFREAFTAAHGE